MTKFKLVLSSIFIFTILFISFMNHDDHTGLYAHTDETMVYCRLARSETYGVFSQAGLLGFCDRHLRGDVKKVKGLANYWAGYCPDYFPYKSQSGGQGFIYALIDKFYKDPFIYKYLCASFLAGVLTSWFIWLCGYFGLITSLLVILGILFFKDLVFFADNIAHVLGATYLIMVAMFWAYEKKIKCLGNVAFCFVLLKLLLNGPEYIFSALLLPFLPMIFYSVLNKTSSRGLKDEFFQITGGVLLAGLVSLLILTVQISMVDSVSGAMHHFMHKAMARTFFPALLPPNESHATMHFTRLQLLCKYLSFSCISMGFLEISFGEMILFFLSVSILSYYLYRRYAPRELLALLLTTWVAILCPLSWIIIAKGHSATHWHDVIVWHMPFTLLGMALTCVTLRTWICGPIKPQNPKKLY